jgi:hypothetical protein
MPGGRGGSSSSKRSQTASSHPDATATVGTRQAASKNKMSQEEINARRQAAKDKADKAGKEAKDKNSLRNKALLGLGITGAIAGGIAAAALADFVASDGAKINILDVKTNKGVWDIFSSSSKLKIKWSVKEVPSGGLKDNVTIIEGDSVYITGTDTPLDGKSWEVKDVPGDYDFVVDLEQDTKDIKSSKGEGVISTSYDDHFDATTSDAAEGTGNLLGSGLSGLFSGLLSILPLILIGLFVFLFIVPLLTSIGQKSKT